MRSCTDGSLWRSAFYLLSFMAVIIFFSSDAMAQSVRDRKILLARQMAECSGAYFASSEAVTMLNGADKNVIAFHEKGNGFLLASAKTLGDTKPSDAFEFTYNRVEERALKIKSAWLDRISDTGDMGVIEINRVTEACTQRLGGARDMILGGIRHELQGGTR